MRRDRLADSGDFPLWCGFPCAVGSVLSGEGADESVCKPDPVPSHLAVVLGGGHPSRLAVADKLVRPTRRLRTGSPRTPAQTPAGVLLALLRVGFAEPPRSPGVLVVSCTTVSPLPGHAGRSVFCGTFPQVALGCR